MFTSEKTAQEENNQDFALRWLEHVDEVKSGYDVDVEDEIDRAVRSNPFIACDEILEVVAREHGHTLQMLETAYPDCRKWYQQSLGNYQKHQKHQKHQEHQELIRQKKERFGL